jgi:CheY-like chemotaxis protein
MQARRPQAQPPTLFWPGYGQSEDVRRAQEVGFDQHLTKPVDFAMLERALMGGVR